MADISMCRGEGCPMADKCYRFLAKPGDNQAYAYFDEDRVDGEPCPAFRAPDIASSDEVAKWAAKDADALLREDEEASHE